MERDNIAAQAAPGFLRDRLLEQSDEYHTFVCDICGLLSTEKECRLCEENKISKIKIPYATKQLIQELLGMGIVCRLVPSPYEGEKKIIKTYTSPY